MTTATVPSARRFSNAANSAVPDRRAYKRFALSLSGRFMRTDKQEFPCRLYEMSVGGIAMTVPAGVAVPLGERIIAYFEHVGGLEGVCVRHANGGIVIKLIATQHKREKLAAQITWLLNRNDVDGAAHRKHERIEVGNRTSTLKLAEGIVINCLVLDVSISGASVSTVARPEIGTEVWLGKLRARVMRHHSEGLGLQFMDIQDPDAMRRYFG